MSSVDDLYLEVCLAVAEGLNLTAERLYEMSQVEVPKSDSDQSTERFGQTLAESGRHPGNDPELGATPDKMTASVIYDNEYAAAQHEGHMVYERGGHPVDWQVENYTSAGTKAHYLSDPAKALMPQLPELVGVEVEARIALMTASGNLVEDTL